jgi:hypothetical protein
VIAKTSRRAGQRLRAAAAQAQIDFMQAVSSKTAGRVSVAHASAAAALLFIFA